MGSKTTKLLLLDSLLQELWAKILKVTVKKINVGQ